MGVSAYPECSRSYLSLNICTSLGGQTGNWCIFILVSDFFGIIPLSLWQSWFETCWEEMKKFETCNIM